MELCQSRRGQLGGMDYLSETRVELRYTMPLGEIDGDRTDQYLPLSAVRAQLALESRPLLPAHPRIKELNAQLEDLDAQIKASAERVVRKSPCPVLTVKATDDE